MTLEELYNEKYGDNNHKVVAAIVNGRLRELTKDVSLDDEVEYVNLSSPIGFDLYKRSLILLMLKAARDVLSKLEGDYRIEVMYSVGSGFFCKLMDTDIELTEDIISKKNLADKYIKTAAII